MKCPEFSEILDVVENKSDAALSRKINIHISECSECAESKVWAERSILAMTEANRLVDAPEFAIQKAVTLLGSHKSTLRDWVRAVLDFDSWAVPATAGVRNAAPGPRQCVFHTENYRVMLMLEVNDQKAQMVGQLVAASQAAETAHCLVEVSDAKGVLGQSATGEGGEFLLEVPANRQLELRIHGDPESILVSCKV